MSIHKPHHTLPCIAGLALLMALPDTTHAASVSTPIDYDFGTGSGQEDVNAVGSDFTTTINNDTSADAQFNTLPDALQMRNSPNHWSNVSATVATDLSAATQSSFSMSSTLTLANMGGNFSRVGLTFFGNGGDSIAAIFLPNNNSIRITSGINDGLATNYVQGTLSGFSAGSTYTLSLVGAFLGNGDLEIDFSLNEVGGDGISGSVSHTFTAAALDDLTLGNEFGVIGRIRDGVDVQYDNLSIIPEPATALLGALGMLALLRRRR